MTGTEPDRGRVSGRPAGDHGSGFVPPPYPYDRLVDIKARAEGVFGRSAGGLADCSIGTPCDPPPASVLMALAGSGTERGYPASIGTETYRRSAADWLERRFGVVVDPGSEIGACVGTKELVASAAHHLRLRRPGRDVVLFPAVSYPTYAMSALLAGCRAVPVPERHGGGLALEQVSSDDARRAVMLWVNSPANPSGLLSDLDEVAEWGRRSGVPIFSDECYCEFTWSTDASTVLSSGTEGVVAVHSLSKRSNLAGLRAGFFAGDSDLVGYLGDVRRHLGLMVPGPVQAAAAVALDDDAHVEVQRAHYAERLALIAGALGSAGIDVPMPAGGFYLWVPVPDGCPGGDWGLTEALAMRAGLLASPGGFYGPDGSGHVRIAVVQPTGVLGHAAERLARLGPLFAT
ncbi:MAG: aminotransferase class I/II-fold pyridoxal phosphate-dependent enzyme [Acidimicrobiales bacterium]